MPVLEDKTPPLRTTSQISVIHPKTVGTLAASGAGLNRTSGQGNGTDFVICIQGNVVDRADTAGANGLGVKESISYTLNTVDRHAVCYGQKSYASYTENTVSPLVASGGTLGGGSENLILDNYIVRRLTPLECERLQGFPDHWTAGHSDTQRYKALGNSIAIPCIDFIMQQIEKILRE